MILFPWKLVRDNVPDQIRARGANILVKQLDGKKYREALAVKLIEEAREVGEARDRQSLINELADLEETMDAYRISNGLPLQEIRKARLIKYAKAGGFGKGFFLYLIYGFKARK